MSERVFEKRWNQAQGLGGFDLVVDADHRGVMVTEGKGTMAGARASLEVLDEALAALGHEPPFSGIVDMRDVTGSPLRASLLLGGWLHKHRHVFGKIAVFGAKPWEMRIARTVAKIARMAKQVGFSNTEAEARRFLGWADDEPRI